MVLLRTPRLMYPSAGLTCMRTPRSRTRTLPLQSGVEHGNHNSDFAPGRRTQQHSKAASRSTKQALDEKARNKKTGEAEREREKQLCRDHRRRRRRSSSQSLRFRMLRKAPLELGRHNRLACWCLVPWSASWVASSGEGVKVTFQSSGREPHCGTHRLKAHEFFVRGSRNHGPIRGAIVGSEGDPAPAATIYRQLRLP